MINLTTETQRECDRFPGDNYLTPTQAMQFLTKKLEREITGRKRQSAKNLAQGEPFVH
jgi:hypothetical protein